MAVKLKNLERIAQSYKEQKYVFKDLSLDLKFSKINPIGFRTGIDGNDLTTSLDLAAIRNSLQNLFNTLPGQRFLFPEYGLDIYQFLFTPITPNNGQAIAEKILLSIEKFEPRIRVENINVIADPDKSEYQIIISIILPAIQQQTTIDTTLNTRTQSFIVLPTSRNI